jgi:UDP-glucuronate 4-epimerase
MLTGSYDAIIHLAARAGVRTTPTDLIGYRQVNVDGTRNLLEVAVERCVKQFVFASSSSVYGVNTNVPWCEEAALLPISSYAAMKLSGEMLGRIYSRQRGIRFVALRLFTVYGPRQRPDLAIHKFSRLILRGEPVPIYGNGGSLRDYTHIDDVVRGVAAAVAYSDSPCEVINLGSCRPIGLLEMVRTIAQHAGVEAMLSFQPEQPGDVPQTYACSAKARALLGYEPSVGFEDGIRSFMAWLRTTGIRWTEVPAGAAEDQPR